MLARAHHQSAIDRGLVADQAAVACKLGLTQVTQLLDLLMLAPDIQEALLFGDGGTGQAERRLRAVVAAGEWGKQRAAWPGEPQISG
jgi:hypothetical protein